MAAGLFLGLVPALHPRVPEEQSPPGAFMLKRGAAAAIAFVTLHGLFGATSAPRPLTAPRSDCAGTSPPAPPRAGRMGAADV